MSKVVTLDGTPAGQGTVVFFREYGDTPGIIRGIDGDYARVAFPDGFTEWIAGELLYVSADQSWPPRGSR